MNTMIKKIHINSMECYNEKTNEFITIEGGDVLFEHSLATIRDWEAKHHTHFLGNKELTKEQINDYIKFMCIDENDIPKLSGLTKDNIEELCEFMEDSMTGQKFLKRGKQTREIITSEKIYSWMFANQIPMEFEHWHINRLLTLLRVCSNNNEPQKKMSQSQIMRQNAQLNAARRAKLNSKG